MDFDDEDLTIASVPSNNNNNINNANYLESGGMAASTPLQGSTMPQRRPSTSQKGVIDRQNSGDTCQLCKFFVINCFKTFDISLEYINQYTKIILDDIGAENRPKTGYRHTQSRIGTAGPGGNNGVYSIILSFLLRNKIMCIKYLVYQYLKYKYFI